MPTAQQTQATALPGSLFGVPGGTLPIEEPDTTQSLATVQSAATSTPVNGIFPFKQTDVVLGWELIENYTATVTAGTGQTITVSPFFPFTLFGPTKLSFQNQYNVIDVVNMRDLGFFLSYRARWYQNDFRNANYAAPVGQLATAGFPVSTWNQANLNLTPNGTFTGSVNVNFAIRFPASIELDHYYPLDISGNMVGAPGRAILSPQYMGGTTRIISPSLTLSAGFGTLDTSPFATTALTPTTDTASTITAATVSTTIRRYGFYSSNDERVLPPVQPWQYALKSFQYPIANQSGTINIPLPNDDGQILSLWVWLWDPTLNSSEGGGVVIGTNIANCRLLYGSSLKRYDDTPFTMQYRWVQQHDQLPPIGFIGWDMALMPDGRLSNWGGILNTLTTNAVTIQLVTLGTYTFSASAYAIVGRELLQYVVPQ
jgi:hypothetical protein